MHEHQVGEVGARDDHQAGDGREEDQERPPRRAGDLLAQRHEGDISHRGIVTEGGGKPAGDTGRIRAGRIQVSVQPSNDHPVVPGPMRIAFALLARHQDLGALGKVERRRQDAHDCDRAIANPQRRRREIGASHCPLPEAVGHHRNRRRADAELVVREGAAAHRLQAEDVEELPRHRRHLRPQGHLAGRDRRCPRGEFRDRGERAALIPDVLEVRIGELALPAAAADLPDRDQAIRLRVRQRLQQHSVDDAVDDRARGQRQRQRADDDQRVGRLLPQRADGESQFPGRGRNSHGHSDGKWGDMVAACEDDTRSHLRSQDSLNLKPG